MADTQTYTVTVTPTDGVWENTTLTMLDKTITMKTARNAVVRLEDGTELSMSVAIAMEELPSE